MFQLKPLRRDSVPAALEKAMRYRLLNEPREAESICRDVLAVEPNDQEALATLVLALSDQFSDRLAERFGEAREAVAQFKGEYERHYFGGIVCERRAKVHLAQATPDAGRMAYDWLRQAMEHYEQAEPLRPQGNDDALLRWNTCVRIIERYAHVQPAETAAAAAVELE